MANYVVTIDTGEWVYIDKAGAPHTVSNAETFTFELTDGGAAAVTYAIAEDQTVDCDDGGEVQLKRDTNIQNVTRAIGPMADANDGTAVVGVEGRWVMSYNNGPEQLWVPASINIDDVDDPTSITATFEDQFGQTFTWSAVTVAAE